MTELAHVTATPWTWTIDGEGEQPEPITADTADNAIAIAASIIRRTYDRGNLSGPTRKVTVFYHVHRFDVGNGYDEAGFGHVTLTVEDEG